uniref:CSON001872 protein n=1 Tax=Culicoides sonorensis TaxID=179676 RepID=A0A336MVD4_CULSO
MAVIRSRLLLALAFIVVHLPNLLHGYLLVVNENTEPGTIIFNASVYKLGSDRHYKINVHRSANFVHHLLKVDHKEGTIVLKKRIYCDGIYYPNLFTFYVDSTSNRLRTIGYYSLPLRIFIAGSNCNDERRQEMIDRHYDDDENNGMRHRRTTFKDDEDELDQQRLYGEYRGSSLEHYLEEFPWLVHHHNISRTDYTNFVEGDVLFDTTESNTERHKIIKRKRRALVESLDQKMHRKIADAKQWISETYASYAIHTTDKWNKICLKQSQFINNLNSFMPKSIIQYCRVNYLDLSDERFDIERKTGDMVASKDICIHEPMWKITVTFNVKCDNRIDVIDADHRLKIVYHHEEFNDTDIAKRVKRELRNQSPYFEKALYVASVLEEQPPSASVTTVKARDPEDSPVVYSMVSLLDSRSQSMFKVDSRTGVVTTSLSLDRELMDVHYFRVIATDDSFPPRSGTTTLQINVLDCNDHSPVFEAEQFETSVRESATISTPVITLRASDQDMGKNADIEYSIDKVETGNPDDSEEDLTQLFRIDSKSGVITTRGLLDRETHDSYVIHVTATDMASPQTERKTAKTTVLVKVMDDNDNYPQFSERTYTVQVSEDQWGDNNVIAHIQAKDADLGNNGAIRYAIIGGNTLSQFTIDSMSGDVTLVKPLDYENVRSYRLVIRAQDGGSPSRSNTTQLLVNVIDANDNAPRFYTSQFQEAVLESVPVGYNIVRVQAYDSDEGQNSEITYSISDRKDNFPLAVDSRTGWIHTTRPLDREEQSRFSFQVVATDGGVPPKSSSTSVVVTVQDVNDNDPIFSPKYYEAILAEDQAPGTPVTSVTATDSDEDARLHYEITSGNTRGRFAITSQNGRGLITIAQPLDFKQEKRFLLTITATDSGGRSDTATLNINITDANNFAPTFENAPYTASINEDAPIDTTVLVVSATDADVGINAQITYYLNDESANGLGSSDPFIINPQTGAITTNAPLDRETTSGYLLTVTAKDGGNPSLSDTTEIEIFVTDVNDSPPTFKVPLYQASILEDALIGTSVAQLVASDADQGLNGRIRYDLSQKDKEDGSFVVDPASGVIRTNKALDRESVAVYHLQALAIDKGTPPLTGTIEVQVRLEDINDSPPSFESEKITLYVAENSPVGSVVGEIYAHDPDEGVNALVQYSILESDDSNLFSLVTKPGSDRAQLLTMTELDYESPRKRFELHVRAASPPLRSDVIVEVLVTDVNDNAPILRDFQVIFNNYKDRFPSGIIGRVPAFDADVSDKLFYKILSGNNANLVKLNSTTGGISLSPQLNTNVPKHATMEISVTDGINEVKSIMQLSVRLVNEDMLFNSVTVRLDEMTEEAFLSPLLNFFIDGLAAIIPCPKENIFIFSIQDDADINSRILNVSFSARRGDVSHEEYYSSNFLQERVYLNRAILARLATVTVLPFDDNICLLEPCLNFEKCSSVLKFGNASGFIHSDTVLFRPIYPVNSFVCSCPEGFTGSKAHYLCDTEVNLCYSNPCQNSGTCVRREGGYTCLCDERHTGDNCELNNSHDLTNCHADMCEGGYSCLSGIHYPSFGSSCQLKSRSFTKNSFLTFESLKQRHRLNIRLKFATIQDNGLLLYNGRFNDKHDFIALEIINGHLLFSFSLGDKIQTVSVTQKKKISDGNWHSVQVEYFNRTATVIVDNCDTALALPGYADCANQTRLMLDRKCASLTETCHRFLDLTGPLQIGGLPRIPAHFQIQSQDYVGCISDLQIDQKLVDLNTYVADNGTIAGCPQKNSACDSDPCYNGGSCIEGFGVYRCECPEGFSGNSCQEAVPSPWRFNGDGILSFNPLLRPIQIPWYNSLSVRTIQKDAFLMQIQIGQNNSATLSIKNGMLHYTYNSFPMYLAGSVLSDGEWHRIEVKWLANEIQLSTDYGERTTFETAPDKIQGVYVGKIVIGGIDGTIGNLEQFGYFEGCIQDVRVGNQQSILQKPTIRENVLDGCMSQAECPEECPHNSRCVTKWDEATCECIPGYVGPKCVPVCTVKPCADAGQCRVDTSNVKGYRCDCDNSYHSGEYCEVSIERPCPTGWWGERECGPCKCNLKQGYHPDCDKENGQCRCRDNHYQPLNETACLPCDCYIIGSLTGQCDKLTGQCDCRDGVIGRRCDSCSNPYAEVTLTGCEVVYDACPKSFASGLWWPRTNFGQAAIENCPGPAKGKAIRVCEAGAGGWETPDLYNCTSEPFLELRKQLSAIEKLELEMNSFVSVKIASDLQHATQVVGNPKLDETVKAKDIYSFESSHLTRNSLWNEDFDINYLSDEVKVPQNRLYGADLLVTEGLLQEILNYEIMQSGLNLSHSQDKYFIRNIVESASIILDKKYSSEWKRLTDLTQRGSDDLIDAFSKYLTVLASYQHDTYTNPFEIVHENMAFGLDVVTSESLFGYEPNQLNEYHRHSKGNQYTTESVILPDTSAFLTHSSKQRIPTIAFPKYNNYILDKKKFDKHTKVQIPLDMLGITPPESNEVSLGSRNKEHRAIVGYAQYKDAGALFPQAFDETITRRYGVDVEVATPVLSLAILVPTDAIKDPNQKTERFKNTKEEIRTTTTTTAAPIRHFSQGIQISAQDPEIFGSDEDTSAGTYAHLGDTYDFPPIDRKTDLLESTRKLVKRDISNEIEHVATDSVPVIYRSLGAPYLSQPIKLQMWLNIDKSLFGPRSNPQCVRWNTFMNMWTRIGCQTQTPDYENLSYEKNDPILINCTCTHISSYAVIVDVIDPEDIPEPSLFVQITSYSAFLISLPILFGVIIALALLRGLQTNSNTIHQNLVFCLFIAELLFFVGMQARRELIDNEFSCKLVAIGLHYAWLAAFAWMTVDCVHLYRMLTEMRDINHGPMGFYYTMGYGGPALICGLSVGVRVHEYGNNLFCWLSVYENVVWWLVGPVAVMSVVNLLILFVSVKAAFTLKEHVLGFGNLRTLLWLSVVSLPLIGLMWVLQVLTASENSQLLSVLLSVVVVVHAIFCLIGYCIINKRVRENLRHTALRCMGRKVPLLESSVAISNSSQNIASNPRTPGFSGYDTNRRNIGISASSTTSRSTAKTSSSPYSDGQLRHTSTSTSNYNSDTYVRGGYQSAGGRKHEGERKKHKGKESDSDSDNDGRSLELASSHSSDDEESKVGRSSIGTATGSYLPNIAEHVATTPPELNVVQSPQLFPNIKPVIYGSRWSSQAPESYLPGPNTGRWSQETASDAEMHSHKTNSPNPLPNPDLTDTAYLQNRLHMPPSLLENIQENYNTNGVTPPMMQQQQQYDNERYDPLYARNKDYQDNYREYDQSYHPTQGLNERAYMSGSERDYGNTQVINHMQQPPQTHPYHSQTIYDKQHIYLGGSKINSPYMSKEQLIAETYSPRAIRSEMAAVYNENGPHHSVSSLLKNDYHTRHVDYHSDRMSEGSDKNGYNFPYTAEEDHLTHPHTMPRALPHHVTNDMNNPVMGSRNGSRTSTPPNMAPVPSMQALTSITDTSEKGIDVDAETTV